MDKKKLLMRIVLLMFFIFILDRVGSRLYWYYTLWWFDMIMHFMGGLWLGLFFAYVAIRKNMILSPQSQKILSIILWVFLVSILWEVFEYAVHQVIGKIPFSSLDTVSDLFFDISGALLGLVYFFKYIMNSTESKVQL